MYHAQLEEAYHLIKAGQKVRAEAVLRPILETEPDNADAWWLLANALPDEAEALDAVDQVLRWRPDHAKAQLMRMRMGAAPVEKRKTQPRRRGQALQLFILMLGVLVLTGAVALGLVYMLLVQPSRLTDPVTYNHLPAGIPILGQILPGETIRAESIAVRDHAWIYNAEANQRIAIQLDSLDSDLDPVLYLYDAQGSLIASNDNAEGLNARIETTLSSAGTYTILASATQPTGGRYALSLETLP